MTTLETVNKELKPLEYIVAQQILYGVPKGSILGPLLLNINLCDMFFILDEFDIGNYADDSTPCVSSRSIEEVIALLEEVSKHIFKWLEIMNLKVMSANVIFY